MCENCKEYDEQIETIDCSCNTAEEKANEQTVDANED